MMVDSSTIQFLLTQQHDPTLPDGWRQMRLDSVATIGFSSVDKKSRQGERHVFLCNYMDVYNKEYVYGHENFMCATASESDISCFSVNPGDVIITKDSETPDDIGVPAVIVSAPNNLVCGYHLALIRPNQDEVDSLFLAKQLAHDRISRYFANLANGMTRYGLATAVVENVPLWLPSIDEQRKIAKVLYKIDETIQKTEQLIAKLKAMKQGLLQDFLTRGLDENGELRDPIAHPEQFKESKFGLIPWEWDIESIEEISSHVGSGLTPRGGSDVYRDSGVMFIRSQNVTFEGLKLYDVAFIDHKTHQVMKRSEVFAHDVLINITGASIGRCCPLPEGFSPANVNQHVCAIRLQDPCFENALFLSTALASPIGQRQINNLNAGSNREGLNYQQLKAILIPWPTRKNERILISGNILHIELQITSEQNYLTKLKLIKKGLMHDLLTGKVRVAQGGGSS